MYAVIGNGKLLALTKKPAYIRNKKDTNSYVPTDELNAEGVFYGEAFAIAGSDKTPYEGAPIAIIKEVDDAERLFEAVSSTRTHTDNISDLDSGIVDLADTTSEMATSIEDVTTAVMELADILSAE